MDPLPGTSSVVHEALTGIERALKSHQLYEGTGPQYRQHVDALFRILQASSTELAINISPFGPYPDGQEPPASDSPARLWFELFEEGVRQIVIRRGVTVAEVDNFLRVLSDSDPNQEDIVTRLWRRELPHIHTHIVRRLVGVCRTPDQAQQDVRERLEYWRSGVMNSPAPDGAAGSDSRALENGDMRLLATAEHSFDWCRLARPRPEASMQSLQRPKMAREVDRYLQDYDRFLDIADVLNDDRAELQLTVLESMVRHGDSASTRNFCEVLLRRSEGMPPTLVEKARAALDGVLSPEPTRSTVDAFEQAPRPALRPERVAADRVSGAPRTAADPVMDSVPVAEVYTLGEAINDPNPRVACEAVNELFERGSVAAVSAALRGYESPSSSVRNLVVVRALRMAEDEPDEAILGRIDSVLNQAFAREEAELRTQILREYEARPSRRRASHVRRWVSNPGFKFRSLDERCRIVRVFGSHTDPKTIAFLGELLTQVRLFSGETEMRFQVEVARVLLRINTHQSRLHVYKVMKGWTVPAKVKAAIQEAINEAKASAGEST